MLEKVIENWTSRLDYIRASRGSPMPEIIFKIRSRRWFAVRGILYKGTLARNSLSRRHQRIEEADISTPVAVDQHGDNYLEEAVRSFTAMRSRCRSSRADVIHGQFFELFGARRSTTSKLA
ncbi:uncharacterized protein TNCV_3646671 [Trichonephila clavipes]|nr:uncharacterized protein TNCV_3646671 [Trichonephila clavipes]